MNCSNLRRLISPLQTHNPVLGIIFLSSVLLIPATTIAQGNISLKSQATDWLMQDAPPNPPLQAWLEGVGMMIKEKNGNVDTTLHITSSVLPSGLVQVEAKVGPNTFVWQVDYPKRKYYSMNKYTSDFMGVVAKGGALRK